MFVSCFYLNKGHKDTKARRFLSISWIRIFLMMVLSLGVYETGIGQGSAISAQLPEEYIGAWYSLDTKPSEDDKPSYFQFFDNQVRYDGFHWMYAEMHKKGEGYDIRIRRHNIEASFHLELYARGYLQITESGKEPYLLKRFGLSGRDDIIGQVRTAFLDEECFVSSEFTGKWFHTSPEGGYLEFGIHGVSLKVGQEFENSQNWKFYAYNSIHKENDSYTIKGFNEQEEKSWKITHQKWGYITVIEDGTKEFTLKRVAEMSDGEAHLKELEKIVEEAYTAINVNDEPFKLPQTISFLKGNNSQNQTKGTENLWGSWYSTDGLNQKAYEFFPWYYKSFRHSKNEKGITMYDDSATHWLYIQFNSKQIKEKNTKNEKLNFIGYNGGRGITFMEIKSPQSSYIEIGGEVFKKFAYLPDNRGSYTTLRMQRVLDMAVEDCEEHIDLTGYTPTLVSTKLDLQTWYKSTWSSASAIFDQDESWVMTKLPLKAQKSNGWFAVPQNMESPSLAFNAYADSFDVYFDGKMIYSYPWNRFKRLNHNSEKVSSNFNHQALNHNYHIIDLPKGNYVNKIIYIHTYRRVDASFDRRRSNHSNTGTWDYRSGITGIEFGDRSILTPYALQLAQNSYSISISVILAVILTVTALICGFISFRQIDQFKFVRIGVGIFLLGCTLFYGVPYLSNPIDAPWNLSSSTYIYIFIIAQTLITVGWLYFAKELYSKKWHDPIGTLLVIHIILSIAQIIQMSWFPMTIPEINHPEIVFGNWKIVLPVVMSKAVDSFSTFLGAILYCTYHISIFFDLVVIGFMVVKNWGKVKQLTQIQMIIFIPFITNYTFSSLFQQLDGANLKYFGAELYLFYILPLIGLLYYLAKSLIQDYLKNTQKVHDFALELERKQNELLRFEQAQMQSEYQALKSQISPHFLFNTFSSLMTVIEESQQKAVNFVQELSSMYRYLLQSRNRELETLDRELEFIESYMFLLRDRYGDYLRLHIDVDKDVLQQHVPSLSLHLLVENAVKHNIISAQKPLDIHISMENDSYLVVKNNLQRKNTLEDSTRIGLENIKNRYAFYTDQQVIIEENRDSFAVKIPLIGEGWKVDGGR